MSTTKMRSLRIKSSDLLCGVLMMLSIPSFVGYPGLAAK
jgi:hypothetical protein